MQEKRHSDHERLQPGFLTVRQASLWTGLSTKSIRRLIKRGLKVYRTCQRGRLLLRPEDLQHFLGRHYTDVPDRENMVNNVMIDSTRK